MHALAENSSDICSQVFSFLILIVDIMALVILCLMPSNILFKSTAADSEFIFTKQYFDYNFISAIAVQGRNALRTGCLGSVSLIKMNVPSPPTPPGLYRSLLNLGTFPSLTKPGTLGRLIFQIGKNEQLSLGCSGFSKAPATWVSPPGLTAGGDSVEGHLVKCMAQTGAPEMSVSIPKCFV